MKIAPRAAASLLALVVLLAGCNGSPRAASAADAANAGRDTAVVRGTVLSEELFPVVHALVSIKDGPLATTDEAGRFELVDVPLGTQTLNITAKGYQPKELKVSVTSGASAETRVSLRGIPGESPYSLLFIHNGIVWCDMVALYTGGPYPDNFGVACPFGKSDNQINVSVQANWVAGVYEMTWKSTEEMSMTSTGNGNCFAGSATHKVDPCWAAISGKSPLRIPARPNDEAYAKLHSIDGKQTFPEGAHRSILVGGYNGYLHTEINGTLYPVCAAFNKQVGLGESLGCPLGIGYALGLRFTLYHATFYLAAPVNLNTYSSVPDQ
jgi:hypothetical protein